VTNLRGARLVPPKREGAVHRRRVMVRTTTTSVLSFLTLDASRGVGERAKLLHRPRRWLQKFARRTGVSGIANEDGAESVILSADFTVGK